MRKILMTMLAAVMLSGGAAFAQNSWAGVAVGWPLLQGYYGVEDALGEDLALRGRVGIQPLVGFGFTVGADILYAVAEFGDQNEFDFYVGGGPTIGYRTFPVVGGGLTFDVTGLAGLEYDLDVNTALFAESRLGFGVGTIGGFGGFGPAFGAALGVRFDL